MIPLAVILKSFFERSKTVVIPVIEAAVVAMPTSIPVKFAPLIAGNVPVSCAAGRLVKFAPLPVNAPLNVVAVVTPVKNTSPSGLNVIPVPTFTFPPIVVIPENIALPSTLILAATPGDAPTSIPFLAVTKPIESTFVTSSYVRVPAIDTLRLNLPAHGTVMSFPLICTAISSHKVFPSIYLSSLLTRDIK